MVCSEAGGAGSGTLKMCERERERKEHLHVHDCWCTTNATSALFGGVVELILVGAREAFLDADVLPEAAHGGGELLAERLRVLHARDHVEH